MPLTPLQFIHNGREVAVFAPGGANLLMVLRDLVGDHSPKFGCGQGGAAPAPCLSTGIPSSPA